MPSRACERLCQHHSVELFDCGDQAYDIDLRESWNRANDGEQTQVFVTLDETDEVTAYLSLTELLVTTRDAVPEGESRDYRFIFVPALAVTLTAQGGDAASRLVRKAYRVREVREGPTRVYAGVAFPSTVMNQRVIDMLERLRFHRPTERFPFWWRPFGT